jgi:peptidoglycan hydrolase-like protein with peptidoglycan-binding domain
MPGIAMCQPGKTQREKSAMQKRTRWTISAFSAAGLLLTGTAAAASLGVGSAPARATLAADAEFPVAINLDNCPTLTEGYHGGCVSQLQTELNNDDNANLPVDDTFGPLTKQAVINFQQEHGVVPALGTVGPQTKAALDNVRSAAPAATPGGLSQIPPGDATVAGYEAYAQSLLAAYGWADQWASFDALVMSESGWNPTIKNPSSGALGIAQALGHGTADTAGSLGNEYGGFGIPDSICQAANSGDGRAQIEWMLNYIARNGNFSDPNSAWAYHQANNSY